MDYVLKRSIIRLIRLFRQSETRRGAFAQRDGQPGLHSRERLYRPTPDNIRKNPNSMGRLSLMAAPAYIYSGWIMRKQHLAPALMRRRWKRKSIYASLSLQFKIGLCSNIDLCFRKRHV